MNATEIKWGNLVERAKNNDQGAFCELYQNSYDTVYRTIKSMVRDDDVALDIVQDAFVKGFDSLFSLDNPDSFLPWLKRIATNKAKDWFKKKHDVSFSQLSDDEGSEPDFEDEKLEHMPDEVIDRNETARLIEEILATLSDEQRIAIGMYYYQDMSVAEIAQELEISENTVKSRLNYGRQKIKASVVALEKKGTKLYGLAPVPFLLWLFRNQVAQAATDGASAELYENIMAKVAMQDAATASGATETLTATAESASGGTVTGTSSGGILTTLGTKIVAGVLAVALVGGGVAYFSHKDKEIDIPNAAISNDHSLFEDASATSAEELLTLFLEEKLIWEKGIYNIEQPTYIMQTSGTIHRIDTVYNSDTGELRQEKIVQDNPYDTTDPAYMKMYKEFETATVNTDISGLYVGDIHDYDGDGDAELLTIYGENNTLYMELFDTEDSKVFSIEKLSLEDLHLNYRWQSIGRYQADDGSTCILVIDSTPQSDASKTVTYYRISGALKPISYLNMVSSNAVEFFYDGKTKREFSVEDVALSGDVSPYITDYGRGEEVGLCSYFDVGSDLTPFIRKYYKKDIDQLRAEREVAGTGFDKFKNTFYIDHYRGDTGLRIAANGFYKLSSTYANSADDVSEYDETGAFGNLTQMPDGSYEAVVLTAEAVETSDVDGLDFTRGYRDTFFTEGSTIHFYPAGTSANVLPDEVWIANDHVSFSDNEYEYNLANNGYVDANGHFTCWVLWMEGSDAAFIYSDFVIEW